MAVRPKTPWAAAALVAVAVVGIAAADPAPPSTRPTTGLVRTTIVVDGKPVLVRGRVCTVVNDDGVVTVNGRPLSEVIDDDPPPATRPTTHP